MSGKQHELTLIGLACLAAVAVLFIGPATAADTGTGSTSITTGAVIIDEQFSSPTLDPAWTFLERYGRGRYSLTDTPGSFRYYGQGSRTGSGLSWWDPTWSHSWPESSVLLRTFVGDRWVLRTSATYHLHGSNSCGSTGAQDNHFVVVFGDGKGPKLDIHRLVDYWYSLDVLGVHLENAAGGDPMTFADYVSPNTPINFKAPDDGYHMIGTDGWIEHTYWYEIVRDGQQVTVRLSSDGTIFVPVRSFTLPPTTGSTQRIGVYQGEWAQVGSSTDVDMVTVHELAGPDPELTVDAGGPYVGTEGSPVTLSAAVPADAAIASYDWDFDGDGTYDRTTATSSTAYTWIDDFVGTLGVRVTDATGQQATDTAPVTIANADPAISSLTVPQNVVPLGTSITATAVFADAGTADTQTIFWDWTDGTDDASTRPHAAAPGTITETHTYAAPGVYPVVLHVADDDGGTTYAIATAFVVVYDPEGGFVTGGGWIDSPAGAYLADPTVTGKATFGFISRYQKGATTPTGQTQFVVQGVDFTFHSTSYDWLVIAGASARYSGSGTVDGRGDYGFMLTAVDGQIASTATPDLFRLRIWEKGTGEVIYDSQGDAGAISNSTAAIGGGSIVIHKTPDSLDEDVNGNGRKDFADVVLYFDQMAWIAGNEPGSAFDYNGNGRIDFADVVWLFNNL